MRKSISRVGHAFTDYPYLAAVSTAPKLFGFADEPQSVRANHFLTSTILMSSVLTRVEWGFIRVMPYRAKLAIDVAGGVVTLAAPRTLGFSRNARGMRLLSRNRRRCVPGWGPLRAGGDAVVGPVTAGPIRVWHRPVRSSLADRHGWAGAVQ